MSEIKPKSATLPIKLSADALARFRTQQAEKRPLIVPKKQVKELTWKEKLVLGENVEDRVAVMAQAKGLPLTSRPVGKFLPYDLLMGECAIEVKGEFTYPDGLYIEVMQTGKASGIETTEANVWMHLGLDKLFYVASVASLRAFIELNKATLKTVKWHSQKVKDNGTATDENANRGYIIPTNRWKEIKGSRVITQMHWSEQGGKLEAGKDGISTHTWKLFGLHLVDKGLAYWFPLVFRGYLPTQAEFTAMITPWAATHSPIGFVLDKKTEKEVMVWSDATPNVPSPDELATQNFFKRNVYVSDVRLGRVSIVDQNVLGNEKRSPEELIQHLKAIIPSEDDAVNGWSAPDRAKFAKLRNIENVWPVYARADEKRRADARLKAHAAKELELEAFNRANPLDVNSDTAISALYAEALNENYERNLTQEMNAAWNAQDTAQPGEAMRARVIRGNKEN